MKYCSVDEEQALLHMCSRFLYERRLVGLISHKGFRCFTVGVLVLLSVVLGLLHKLPELSSG